MPENSLRALESIERALALLASIEIERYQRETNDSVQGRPRKAEVLMSAAGYSGVEIARLLGKSPQAVSQALAKSRGRTPLT